MRSPGRREQVLGLLRAAGRPRSIVEVADELGVHPNTARFHLEALQGAGRVERVTPAQAGPGRPPLLFQARRGMDPAGLRNYELLAAVLLGAVAEDPAAAQRAADSGRAWGRRLAAELDEQDGPDLRDVPPEPADRLVALLEDLGFAPERRTAHGEQQVGLRHCPFLELAGPRTDVVCPVHLGLMQGAMESFGSAVTVDALEPFAEPDLCLAHLGNRQREERP
ncbi:MAG: helix-turn-helix transcriptional regulator [Marmoricola sp.]